MANKVTPEEILYINEVYAACHSYTQTAQIVGRAPSTVKKYIISDFKSEQKIEVDNIELPPIEEIADQLLPWYDLTCLTPEEEKEIKILWKELLV